MQQGDRVRVKESVVVFTHPEHRGKAFDMQGQEGAIATVLDDWKGRTNSKPSVEAIQPSALKGRNKTTPSSPSTSSSMRWMNSWRLVGTTRPTKSG